MNKNIYILFISIGALLLSSCEKFLDERPKSSLALFRTVQDYQAIMDNETQFNDFFPFAGDYASDYYYLSDSDFNSLPDETRNNYLWQAEPPHISNWQQAYSAKIYPANVVIEGIDEAALGVLTEGDRKRIKGEAFFSRGFAFYHLAQLFAPPYQRQREKELLGIPIRLTADINVGTSRANLEETYLQILADLHTASSLLPQKPSTKVRPGKAAAFAALSRVYLIMQDFKKAELYADSSLAFDNGLIDYNDLNPNSVQSQFPIMNKEVIFHANRANFSSPFGTSKARVDTVLFKKYENEDLRGQIFYKENLGFVKSFYGDYAGGLTVALFFGIATDEMYLTSAECKIRNGDLSVVIDLLNDLLKNRYEREEFSEFKSDDPNVALKKVIEEREKELAFRSGIRWSDLRRLNLEPQFAKTIYRKIAGKVYSLEPNDKRYTFKIPYNIIERAKIEQNE